MISYNIKKRMEYFPIHLLGHSITLNPNQDKDITRNKSIGQYLHEYQHNN